jgi:hypothetical protein
MMDRHGITLLAGQIAVLAIATFGAVAMDHFDGERQKRAREQESAATRSRDHDAAGTERP